MPGRFAPRTLPPLAKAAWMGQRAVDAGDEQGAQRASPVMLHLLAAWRRAMISCLRRSTATLPVSGRADCAWPASNPGASPGNADRQPQGVRQRAGPGRNLKIGEIAVSQSLGKHGALRLPAQIGHSAMSACTDSDACLQGKGGHSQHHHENEQVRVGPLPADIVTVKAVIDTCSTSAGLQLHAARYYTT